MIIVGYENGKRVEKELSEIESAAIQSQQEQLDREYWSVVNYDEAVDTEIRKRYTISQEFAILRQRDEKPEEYATYYAYCESCKTFVKEQKEKYK